MKFNNYKEFLTSVEAYYGDYRSDIVRKEVFNYIKSNYKVSELPNLFDRLKKRFSNRYAIPPDEALFYDLKGGDEARLKIEALSHYEKLTKLANSSNDILIFDPIVAMTIRGMGGWVAFCQRPVDDEVWSLKRFTELYILYSENAPNIEVPQKLKGIYEVNPLIVYGTNQEYKQFVLEKKKESKQISDIAEKLAEDLKLKKEK